MLLPLGLPVLPGDIVPVFVHFLGRVASVMGEVLLGLYSCWTFSWLHGGHPTTFLRWGKLAFRL